MMNTIKVGTFPGEIKEFAVEQRSTIAQVLELAELNAEGYQIKLDGRVADMNEVLPSDAKNLLLIKAVKGAMQTIKCGCFPGEIKEYGIEDGMTVNDVIELAGLTTDGFQIKLDGRLADLDEVIQSTDKNLLLIKAVKGAK